MIRRLMALAVLALAVCGCAGPQALLGSRPMRFFCPNLAGQRVSYDHRQFADLQADAVPRDPRTPAFAKADAQNLEAGSAIFSALKRPAASTAPAKYLLLSGGGQWGAFGAGFLAEGAKKERDWQVVTGISTGAIQALFVGAGQYERMAQLYGIPDKNPASSNGFFGLLTKGSEHDLTELRNMLRQELLQTGDNSLLAGLTDPGSPEVLIGMVEGRSTNLMVVLLSQYLRTNLGPGGSDGALSREQVADCVTGLTLASSAIPLRLTPIQIDISGNSAPTGDYRTFMDGGVRLSVIDRQAIQIAEAAYAERLCNAAGLGADCDRTAMAAKGMDEKLAGIASPELYVVRNGPTIVPPEDWIGTAIDTDPDAYVTALRGYSILVNQNELASITELKARYPGVTLNFISADGYNWMEHRSEKMKVCPDRKPDVYFDREFMQCLVGFGRWRRKDGAGGWRQIGAEAGAEAALAGGAPRLPSDEAFALVKRMREITAPR